MKKTTILCVGLCAAMAFTSCKSNESAYKRAYEKAKQYDTAAAQQAPQTPQTAAPQTTEEVAVVAPLMRHVWWIISIMCLSVRRV